MEYKKLNNILGWSTFLVAAYTYLSTIEPTVSFWDCGEYIATAFKLEVGHPPGGPFFQMLGRLVTMFTPADKAAMMINSLSALCSAFTILFLFWSITALAGKLMERSGRSMDEYKWVVLGAGVIGGLAYTWSDTFWFSAVEGEVYAMSSFFTAFVFWAILKWEAIPTEKHPDRWLVLIAYFMGLSIGVHLLNLLTIPALAFVYYFKKNEVTRKGIIQTAIVSFIILFGIQYGIVQYMIKAAAYFELAFVNGMGLPFGSGMIIYGLLIIAAVVYGLKWTHKKTKPQWNTAILCFMMICIGYSSYGQIVVRSAANTPMDENNPENVFAFISYLSREQYGDRPLLYGQYFNAPLDKRKPYLDGTPVYWPDPEKGKYVVTDDKKQSIPNYDPKFESVFPRMYSDKKNHIRAYKDWSGFKGGNVKPSFAENIKFFFSYQINWMYMRYFLWNFTGRQNDAQGHGNILDGNWYTGIPFIDEIHLGPQDNLPESMTNNKAYNRLYCLPLLLGLLGLFFHYYSDKKGFSVVMILFLLTGLGIIIFLNQYPYQPRERDYAYAASFYAFAIWIGLGVIGLYELIKKYIPGSGGALASVVLSAAIPAIMVSEEWDDHDRSGLYTARDFAANYLNSCEKNAILFTNGDNDTFPLWYAQEVEGIRTDVRVMNLSLSNTDWYIDQMSRKAYDSDPVPFSMSADQYRQGTRDYVPFYESQKIKGYTDLKKVMDFVKSENPQAKIKTQSGKWLNYIPTKKFSLSVPREKVLANGTVSPELADQIVPNITWEKKGNYVLKNSLMQLDMLQHNDWERPVYFAITVGGDAYLQLENYFQLEGLAYRLVPIRTRGQGGQTGRVETDIMYDNVMNKFKWGGMEGNVYMGETNMRMTYNLRNNFARLADALLREGKTDSAINVLDKCIEVMPDRSIPYNFFMTPIAEAYYRADEVDKANAIMVRLMEIYEDDLDYYFSVGEVWAESITAETQRAMSVFQRLLQIAKAYKQADLSKQLEEKFAIFQANYQSLRPVQAQPEPDYEDE